MVSEAAIWLAVAWSAIIGMAIVATRWEPRHSHPNQLRCRCIECSGRRLQQ